MPKILISCSSFTNYDCSGTASQTNPHFWQYFFTTARAKDVRSVDDSTRDAGASVAPFTLRLATRHRGSPAAAWTVPSDRATALVSAPGHGPASCLASGSRWPASVAGLPLSTGLHSSHDASIAKNQLRENLTTLPTQLKNLTLDQCLRHDHDHNLKNTNANFEGGAR